MPITICPLSCASGPVGERLPHYRYHHLLLPSFIQHTVSSEAYSKYLWNELLLADKQRWTTGYLYLLDACGRIRFQKKSRGVGKSSWPRPVRFAYKVELEPGGWFGYVGDCHQVGHTCLGILARSTSVPCHDVLGCEIKMPYCRPWRGY